MKNVLKLIGVAAVAAAIGPGIGSGPVVAAPADPEAACENTLLTYHQRYICKQRVEDASTKAALKKVQKEYTDIARDAEKAQKEKK